MIADFEVLTWDVAITTIFWLSIYGDAHWRHLANTTEPSMCGVDAALQRQITLTTCIFMFVVMNPVCRRNKSMMTTMRRVLTSAALSYSLNLADVSPRHVVRHSSADNRRQFIRLSVHLCLQHVK